MLIEINQASNKLAWGCHENIVPPIDAMRKAGAKVFIFTHLEHHPKEWNQTSQHLV
jgi:homospermidine synthase